jgi:predicted P-loop ATPase
MTIDFEDTIPDEKSNVLPMVQPEKRGRGRPQGSGKKAKPPVSVYGSPQQSLKNSQMTPAQEWHPCKRSNEEIEKIIGQKYVFQYEEFTDSYEMLSFGTGGEDNIREMEEHDYTDVFGYARTQSHADEKDVLRNEKNIKQIIRWSANKNRYNYVEQYLEECCSAYEEKLRQDPKFSPLCELLSCFHPAHKETPGDMDHMRVFIVKWMLGCVAKTMRDDGFQNPVLTFSGGQEAGKSFFAEWLSSGLGRKRDDLFQSGEIRPDDRDHKITAATTWIWDVSEIDATTRRQDISAMKDFITKKKFKARRPYAFCDSKFRAKANFIASLNHERFLKDETGNRRYFVITLRDKQGIEWRYSKEIDVNMLWGQVAFLFSCSESSELDAAAFQHLPSRPELTAQEKEWQNASNDAAFQSDNEHLDESLSNWLVFTGKPEHRVASADILGMIKSHLPAQHAHDLNDTKWLRLVSSFMTRKKAQQKQLKVNGSVIRGYVGVTWRDGNLRSLANAPL